MTSWEGTLKLRSENLRSETCGVKSEECAARRDKWDVRRFALFFKNNTVPKLVELPSEDRDTAKVSLRMLHEEA